MMPGKELVMRLFASRKAVAVTAASAVIVAVTAIAGIAYWTTSGSGTGSATTGTSTPVTIVQTGTITNLSPGGSAPVDFKINNPGSNQYVASVAISIVGVEDMPGHAATGCSTADFSLTQPKAINADLPHGDTTFVPSGATLALNDAGKNQDGCQNVTVKLAFDAS
jgi:hypothetical protein